MHDSIECIASAFMKVQTSPWIMLLRRRPPLPACTANERASASRLVTHARSATHDRKCALPLQATDASSEMGITIGLVVDSINHVPPSPPNSLTRATPATGGTTQLHGRRRRCVGDASTTAKSVDCFTERCFCRRSVRNTGM